MKYADKVQEVRNQIMSALHEKIRKQGEASAHTNERVIAIDFNIEDDPSPRSISELGYEQMIDSSGYGYSYACLSTDSLAELLDKL